MRVFDAGRVKFGGDRSVVIAEAGVNHLGRMDYAERLVKGAAAAGADVIKFQTYKAKTLTTRGAPRFWNWEGEEIKNGSQFDSYSRLDSFGKREYSELKDLCDEYEIEFMSTPFDAEAVEMLEEIGVSTYKVASCDITNAPLLRLIGQTGKPVMLSTGASQIPEIEDAINELQEAGSGPVVIMHCTLTYPTPAQDAHLAVVADFVQRFNNHLVGLSDHTLGWWAPAIAVAFGARVIEKHFTFDKTLPGSADHWLSVDEDELALLVEGVRFAERAVGSGRKTVLESEQLARSNARRSLVAATNIPRGHRLRAEDIAVKRPGTGMSPRELDRIIGRTMSVAVAEDHLFSTSDFQSD